MKLVPPGDDIERLFLDSPQIRRWAKVAKLVREFRNVAMEFCEGEFEYLAVVNELSQQDVKEMIRHLAAEVASVEYENAKLARKLKRLRPERIWSGR